MPPVRRDSKHERTWIHQYEQLKKYKEIHGNCNVSGKRGSLGIWVSTQRTNYRLLKEGKASPMTDDRIRNLESIDFQWISERSKEWIGGRALTNKERHDLWHKRYQELKDYMETHGSCNVLTTHGSLGRWVSNQRTTYRWLKEGKSSPMNDERIRKLESIGFQWITKVAKERGSGWWHGRFQELKKYIETHGDCNVSSKHVSFRNWVSTQRQDYRLLKEGKPSPMTDDRIRKLESIGFQWVGEHEKGGGQCSVARKISGAEDIHGNAWRL